MNVKVGRLKVGRHSDVKVGRLKLGGSFFVLQRSDFATHSRFLAALLNSTSSRIRDLLSLRLWRFGRDDDTPIVNVIRIAQQRLANSHNVRSAPTATD